MATQFEKIAKVLEHIKEQSGQLDVDFSNDVRGALRMLTSEYGQLEYKNRRPIDYARAGSQAAYAFRCLGAHSEWFRKVFACSRPFWNTLFSREKVSVTALGGGPGTELFAFLTLAEERGFGGELNFTSVDNQDEWEALRSAIRRSYEYNVKLKCFKIAADLSDIPDISGWDIGKMDVITASYVLSELWSYDADGRICDLIEQVQENIKIGSGFVYIDNLVAERSEEMDEIFSDKRFSLIASFDDVSARLPGSEQIDVLSEYRSLFRESPKLTGEISGRLWKKVA